MGWTLFLILAGVCIVVALGLLFLVLFEPAAPYEVSERPAVAMDSDEFACLLGTIADAEVRRGSRVEVLTNGDVFYDRMLADIRAARHTINEENYIFDPAGHIGRRFVEALTERARAGVKVRLVLDAIGSFSAKDAYFKDLRAAGGQVVFYHPFRWYTLRHLNNRTHRNLLVIDGRMGYTAGAGVRDWWLGGEKGKPQWRDSAFRVEGSLVTGLQTAFLENWIDAAGQVLTGPDDFPACQRPTSEESNGGSGGNGGSVTGLVVVSNAEAGGVTRARVLFQTLLACAGESVRITTPYFVPGKTLRRELVRAVGRGVKVTLLTPGPQTDQMLTYRSGRRRYGELLKGGVEVYEYQPAMIHAKAMVVDGVWSVVGTANYDPRSFGINDEVNLAAQDRALAARLAEDFERDLSRSKRITYEDWRRRPLRQRVVEWAGWVLERHQ